MSKKYYKVISNELKNFNFGDILTLRDNALRFSCNNKLIDKYIVENSPKFFELVEYEYTEEELLFKLSKFDNFYRTEDSKYLVKEAIDELRKYLLDFKESMD